MVALKGIITIIDGQQNNKTTSNIQSYLKAISSIFDLLLCSNSNIFYMKFKKNTEQCFHENNSRFSILRDLFHFLGFPDIYNDIIKDN